MLVDAITIEKGKDESADKHRNAATSSKLVPPDINTSMIFFFFLLRPFDLSELGRGRGG